MHGRLRLKDYTATASTAIQLQRSIATCTSIPSRQPTKSPLTLASSYSIELIAGAHAFFGIGALLVAPWPVAPEDDAAPASKPNYYCYSKANDKSETADCN